MRAWLPERVLESVADRLPHGVEVDIYDGGDVVPASSADVEFFVPPFSVPPFTAPHGGSVLEQMPRLRVVQALTAGVDALRTRVPGGVTLCNARGVHDASTAEWVLGAVLGALHEFPRFARAAHTGTWDHDWTDSLAGKTVLIVGYGSIGEAVERRLAGFEVEVARVARTARPAVAGFDALPDLLTRAHVVVLLVPFTSETRGMVDAAFLSAMPDGALLVNAARGPIVDTTALVKELTSGRLRAAVDVTDPEPLPADHALWQAPGLLLTPHVAGSTPVSAQRALDFLCEQLERYMSGQRLRNIVTGSY